MTDHALKNRAIQITTWLSVFLNLILIAAKFAVGILFGAVSLITDGVHSLSDVFSDIVIFFALKFSLKDPDREHPYGHGKMENLVAVIVGILLIGVSATFIFESAKNLMSGELSHPKGILPLIVAGVSVISKEILFQITRYYGKKVNSPAIIANAWHHRSDAFSSVVALVALGLSGLGFIYGDIIGSMLIAVILIRVGVKIIISNSPQLLEAAVEPELSEKAAALINSVPGVSHLHQLKLRYVGDKIFGEVIIEVDGELTVREGHSIALLVKKHLFSELESLRDISVHIDPLDGCQGDTSSKN